MFMATVLCSRYRLSVAVKGAIQHRQQILSSYYGSTVNVQTSKSSKRLQTTTNIVAVQHSMIINFLKTVVSNQNAKCAT